MKKTHFTALNLLLTLCALVPTLSNASPAYENVELVRDFNTSKTISLLMSKDPSIVKKIEQFKKLTNGMRPTFLEHVDYREDLNGTNDYETFTIVTSLDNNQSALLSFKVSTPPQDNPDYNEKIVATVLKLNDQVEDSIFYCTFATEDGLSKETPIVIPQHEDGGYQGQASIVLKNKKTLTATYSTSGIFGIELSGPVKKSNGKVITEKIGGAYSEQGLNPTQMNIRALINNKDYSVRCSQKIKKLKLKLKLI